MSCSIKLNTKSKAFRNKIAKGIRCWECDDKICGYTEEPKNYDKWGEPLCDECHKEHIELLETGSQCVGCKKKVCEYYEKPKICVKGKYIMCDDCYRLYNLYRTQAVASKYGCQVYGIYKS